MSAARTFGFGILGAVIGAAAGVGLGLIGGLGYAELASVSGFEGYSGFVVAYWMLGGLIAGIVLGIPIAIKQSRRGQGRHR